MRWRTVGYRIEDDGDTENAASVTVGFQALANRTKYLKDHVDVVEAQVYGNYTFTGPAGVISAATKADLTQVAAAGCTLASNQVDVPSAGLYLIEVHATGALFNLSPTTGDPGELEFRINGSVAQFARSWSYDGTTARTVNLAMGGVFALAAHDKIDVRTRGTSFVVESASLSVVRVK